MREIIQDLCYLVSEGIYLITGDKGIFPRCNSLLITTGSEIIIIDPGAGVKNWNTVLSCLNIKLKDINRVLLTHVHVDHSSCAWLFEENGSEVFIHPLEAQMLSSRDDFLPGLEIDPKSSLASEFRVFTDKIDWKPIKEPRYLDPGIIIDVPGGVIQGFHAPGHTRGNIVFELPEKILFTADYDLTDFPYCGNSRKMANLGEFIATVKTLAEKRPSMVISGHRFPITVNIQEEFRIYLGIVKKRLDRIVKAAKDARSPFNTVELYSMDIIYPLSKIKGKKFYSLYEHFNKVCMDRSVDYLLKEDVLNRSKSGKLEIGEMVDKFTSLSHL